MEIELFTVINKLNSDKGIKKEIFGHKIAIAKITGKHLRMSTTCDENFKPDYKNFYNEFLFSCKFDLPFEVKVKLNSGKNRNLNTEIFYTNHPDNLEKEGYKYYTYLSFWQRFTLKRKRNQLWIQQSSNIMWIVNVLVAILAIIAAISTVK